MSSLGAKPTRFDTGFHIGLEAINWAILPGWSARDSPVSVSSTLRLFTNTLPYPGCLHEYWHHTQVASLLMSLPSPLWSFQTFDNFVIYRVAGCQETEFPTPVPRFML